MQTFLPYPSFAKSVQVLDQKRLGKQRVETLQIMSALLTGSGWVNHPATVMWRNYEWALLHYQKATFREWSLIRGYKDTCFQKTMLLYFQYAPPCEDNVAPCWFGNEHFHRSHQSNLIRKNPEYYGPLFPGVPDNLPYIWPINTTEET